MLGVTDPELVEVFRREPAEAVYQRGEQFDCVDNELALGGRNLALRTQTTLYNDVFLPLNGRHQGDNAACALAAVEAFFDAPVPEDIVLEAFASVQMPGRFEVLGHQPLVIIDGAHNPHGADRCAEVFFDDFDPVGRRILVVGFLRGREPVAMLEALRADEFDLVVCCTAPSPRGIPSGEVVAAARSIGCDQVVDAGSVERACDRALSDAQAEDAVLIAGSLYVVGDARHRHLPVTCLRLPSTRSNNGVTSLPRCACAGRSQRGRPRLRGRPSTTRRRGSARRGRAERARRLSCRYV